MANSRVEGIRPIKLLFALTVLICVMLIAPAAAAALPDRVNVNASYNIETPDYGDLNFSSIQDAVYGVAEGGEVWVYNGTYNESVLIDRSMTVMAISRLTCSDPGEVTIDAMGEDVGIEIIASNVSFSGFEVMNTSAVGIYAHGASAVTIEYNSVAVRNDTYNETYGIFIEGGSGIALLSNQVYVIGSSMQMGVAIEGVNEAYVYDNEIVAAALLPKPTEVGMVSNPVVTASIIEKDEPLFAADAADLEWRWMEPNGIWICDSASVAVESNRVVSGGACTADDPALYYSVVDAWGIRSCTSENVKLLENNVTVVGVAANLSRTAGIYGSGDLTLIEGNTVETYTDSREVQPVGIRLGYADKGQVLDNVVDMEVDCAGTIGNGGLRRATGIMAFDSYKAQVLRNTVSFALAATGPNVACQVKAEGIFVDWCDESRVSENIVIVKSEIVREQTRDESVEAETPLRASGSVTGIEIGMSDEPEILENVVHAFGTVIAYDGATEDNPLTGVISDLVLTGIGVRGGYDEPVVSPVIYDNVVVVRAQAAGLTNEDIYFAEVEAALADNGDLLTRYVSVMQDEQEGSSAAACLSTYLTDAEAQSVITNSVFEYEPSIVKTTLVAAQVATAGIVLEDVLDPTVCHNYVPVYQDIIVYASDMPVEEDATFESALPIGLIEQIVTGEQMQQATLLSLIDENDSEWQNLSEADRTAITDAVLSGDEDVLAAYAENETLFATESDMAGVLSEYQALLDEDAFEFLNVTRLAATVPVSQSYGLYLIDAEGYSEVHDNNFTVQTTAISIAVAEGDNLDAPDAAAGSAGLVMAFGISGTGDEINVEDNCIDVSTHGTFLNLAGGGANETADAAAGSAHLLLAVGVSADADDKSILNNEVIVTQGSSGISEAMNRAKDQTTLSIAAMAGVGVGIVLDASEVFDPDTYEPAPPEASEWFPDAIEGNTVLVTDDINAASIAEVLLDGPLDGSSNALSGAIGAAASFGIVAPEAIIADNVVTTTANQSSMAAAVVMEVPFLAVQAAEIDLPGAGAANLGVAASGGILTLRSYIVNNTVNTWANSETVVEAATEELLEDAGVLAGTVVADVGIVSLSPSYIDGNTVDGEVSGLMLCTVDGDRVDTGFLILALDLGILSRGSDATFNNIHNGYIGFPYYYEEEVCEPYAFYNWWGDASGPSGFGPGTGSPVTGTMNYEPWLTKPADVVLETGKSYFGLEIGSPNIGGDGYREGLRPGANTLSFPLALENNTWQAVTHSGDGLNYSVACTWNAASQQWVQVTDTTRINPLDAVYIKMNDYDRLPVAISPEITDHPPVKTLRAGWNLVGPAYDLRDGPIEVPDNYLWWGEPYGIPVTRTLASVEKTPAGLTGYIVVVSPSINPETWVYTPGDGTEPDMDATCGYWVFMENPDTLAGFSSTPLPMPEWAWDL